MPKVDQILRLRQLADMVLQSDLAKLRKSADARQSTMDKIAGLSHSAPELGPAFGPADAQAALRYQTWADLRRAEMMQTLATQTAQWLDCRDGARQSFGKVQAFDSIQHKLR
jgi:hypothetical protein